MGNSRNWSQIGDDIEDIMRSVMESQDFKKLNETIAKTADQALENVQKGVERFAGQRMTNYRTAGEAGNAYEGRRANSAEAKKSVAPVNLKERFKGAGGMKGAGLALAICGYTFLITLLLGWGIAFALTILTSKTAAWVTTGVLAPFVIGSAFMAWKGSGMLSQTKRFRSYTSVLKEREFCEIEELALAAGKSETFVKKDLRKMIQNHLFLQGHLDKQQTTLMVTENAYQQYLAAQKELESRQEKERIRKSEESILKRKAELSNEVKEVILTGKKYLAEIEACNERIPGIEISEKISRLELVIAKIFNRVEQHPELVDDLGRFIDYYLPTTVKLLRTYEDLDAQPVEGTNIQTAKQEIENTLDTIDKAFEKLLDSFFEDAAWDVSTDISVLQNMFVQEGLTESELTMKK